MADHLHQDESIDSSLIPAIHQEGIADLVEAEENQSASANVLRRVLREKRGNFAGFNSVAATDEND